VNDIRTAQFQADEDLLPAEATSVELVETDSVQSPALLHRTRLALTSLAFAAVVSTTRIHHDIPARERGAETSTTIATPRPYGARQVSIAEARRIAREVMAEAESRRAAFAEHEAAQEAVWEEPV
jgi:hypothetical protein